MNTFLIIPKNKRPLYVFYLMVSSLGTHIPFEKFEEITPSYRHRGQLNIAISQVRAFLEPLGYQVESIRGFGYKCIKQEVFKWKK